MVLHWRPVLQDPRERMTTCVPFVREFTAVESLPTSKNQDTVLKAVLSHEKLELKRAALEEEPSQHVAGLLPVRKHYQLVLGEMQAREAAREHERQKVKLKQQAEIRRRRECARKKLQKIRKRKRQQEATRQAEVASKREKVEQVVATYREARHQETASGVFQKAWRSPVMRGRCARVYANIFVGKNEFDAAAKKVQKAWGLCKERRDKEAHPLVERVHEMESRMHKLFEESMRKWEEEWTAEEMTPPSRSLCKLVEDDAAFGEPEEYEYSLCALKDRVACWPEHAAESCAWTESVGRAAEAYAVVCGLPAAVGGVVLKCATISVYGIRGKCDAASMLQMDILRVKLGTFGLKRDMATHPFRNTKVSKNALQYR